MRSIILISMFIVVAPVDARADMLVAEIGWQQPAPITLPASFDMTVVNVDTGNQASISSSLTSPDQTMVMTLDNNANSIALFNQVLANSPNAIRRVYITNDGQIIAPPFGHGPFDAIWFPDSDPNDGFHAEAHVPPVFPPYFGLGLWGYWLTSVKQIVTPTGQTVYFYGTVIPEPTSALLILLGAVCHLSRRCRGSRKTIGHWPRP